MCFAILPLRDASRLMTKCLALTVVFGPMSALPLKADTETTDSMSAKCQDAVAIETHGTVSSAALGAGHVM